jgi:hypothetical protein
MNSGNAIHSPQFINVRSLKGRSVDRDQSTDQNAILVAEGGSEVIVYSAVIAFLPRGQRSPQRTGHPSALPKIVHRHADEPKRQDTEQSDGKRLPLETV